MMTFLGLDKKDWIYRESIVDDPKEKIRCLSNALIVDPTDANIWYELGERYTTDKDKSQYCWSMAAKCYKNRLEKFKVDAIEFAKDSNHLLFMDVKSSDIIGEIEIMYFSLGSTYLNLDKFNLASEAYLKSYSFRKNDPDCLYFAAKAYYYSENYDKAKELLLQNIDLTSEFQSYYLLGLVHLKQGNIRLGLSNFWKCIENADYHDAESYYYKHLAYNELGNLKKTEYYLKKAFECEPNKSRAFDLVDFYEQTENHSKCKKYYDLLHSFYREKFKK